MPPFISLRILNVHIFESFSEFFYYSGFRKIHILMIDFIGGLSWCKISSCIFKLGL